MSLHSPAASHTAGKGKEPDAVFTILKKANDAIQSFGQDKVINASIGAIFTEDEKFATLSAVEEYFRQLPAEEFMSYAPIAGLPEFLDAVVEQTFMGCQPKNTYARAVATPGGTGAVRHAFFNYLEVGQKALIPDWAWAPYYTIAHEHMRDVDTYKMFDQEYKFNLNSIMDKTTQLLKSQDNVLIVFNTPAHNPTGYSITTEEWSKLVDFFKNCAADESKKVVILLDMAYIDYAGKPEETRKFLRLFEGMPENMLVAIAYSMSKSFLIYGMRSGALVGLSSSKDAAEEFFQINSFSNRAVWSNGTRGAQKLLADVAANPILKAEIDKEREIFSDLLFKRAGIFLKEAEEVGLQTLPYKCGFFITVPAANPQELTEKLMESNIFTVPNLKGVRFAVCAVPTYKISGIAGKTKEALNKLCV